MPKLGGRGAFISILISVVTVLDESCAAEPLQASRLAAAFDQASKVQLSVPSSREGASIERFYGGVEYLNWQVKGAALSVPTVTTGPIETTHHGWLINSDTTILYGAPQAPALGGNDTQNFPRFSGARLTLGYWLDDAKRFAVEANGFALQSRSTGFTLRGDSVGSPVINIPVYNTIPYDPFGRSGGLPPAEDGLPASLTDNADRFDGNAGVFTGGVKIVNKLQLWGIGVTEVATVFRGQNLTVSALGGFRHLNLSESFNLNYDSTGRTGVYLGQSGIAWDQFRTSNRFFGADLGLRTLYQTGPFSIELVGRVALGVNQEVIDITGGFSSFNYITPIRSGPEGIFAQPANEGRYSSVDFAVVPEAQIKFGYQISPTVRLSLGYDILYESSVVRPGDQINRNLPKGQTFEQGRTAASATSPTRLFNTTDFFAHGVGGGLSVDLGSAAAPPVEITLPRPVVDWSGWYVGANLGWKGAKFSGRDEGSSIKPFTTSTSDVTRFSTLTGSGASGGAQGGFNWQVRQWVFGVEAGLFGSDAQRQVAGPGSAVFATNDNFTYQTGFEAMLRTRGGVAFDRWLIYGAAGLAVAGLRVNAAYGPGSFFVPGAIAVTSAAAASDYQVLLGGTLGLGIEYALTREVSAGIEYRYNRFGSNSFALGTKPFPGGGSSTIASHVAENDSVISARFNYHLPH